MIDGARVLCIEKKLLHNECTDSSIAIAFGLSSEICKVDTRVGNNRETFLSTRKF